MGNSRSGMPFLKLSSANRFMSSHLGDSPESFRISGFSQDSEYICPVFTDTLMTREMLTHNIRLIGNSPSLRFAKNARRPSVL